MTRKQIITWWIYSICAVVLIYFVAPALISAADTILVLLGVFLLVSFVVWSYYLWIRPLAKLIKDFYNEL
jgi:hypothetical protein